MFQNGNLQEVKKKEITVIRIRTWRSKNINYYLQPNDNLVYFRSTDVRVILFLNFVLFRRKNSSSPNFIPVVLNILFFLFCGRTVNREQKEKKICI